MQTLDKDKFSAYVSSVSVHVMVYVLYMLNGVYVRKAVPQVIVLIQ